MSAFSALCPLCASCALKAPYAFFSVVAQYTSVTAERFFLWAYPVLPEVLNAPVVPTRDRTVDVLVPPAPAHRPSVAYREGLFPSARGASERACHGEGRVWMRRDRTGARERE